MTSPQQFDCIFCKDSFESKEKLQIHFRKHGDPKFNQSLKSSPIKNQGEMGSQMEQGSLGEVVNCDVCSEVFPTISKAITHKHKVHPDHDAKYFCPWCGKLFTMKHLYNKHVQSTHDDKAEDGQTGFHCDYCEVDFFMPSAMLYHNKFFHRQDTELAAIGHSKKMKMFNEEMLQLYYCPFCGEEYSNKVNLHKHMGDDHIDENQIPDDVLRCPLCEAVFYHLDAYELHLTFHSTTDLYSEGNELANQVTEFSLETVSPIMEKVENETQEEEAADASQIEEFLQQALNETNDQDNSNDSFHKEKKKKHKKHKKSKKEKAITLDEFLTMNTDVFGEGLDFQGIEEVPTQIVAKQLNRKKPGPKPLPSELAKLKKQGFTIKKNPAKTTSPLQGMRIGINKQVNRPVNTLKDVNKTTVDQNKQNVLSTPDDVLSKLLNQSNSQIKIVKKSASESTNKEIPKLEKDCEGKKYEPHQVSDPVVRGAENQENDTHIEYNDGSKEINTFLKDSTSINNAVTEQEDDLTAQNTSQDMNQTKKEVNYIYNTTDFKNKELLETENDIDVKNMTGNACIETEKKDTADKSNIVHNLGQHITIKSLPSPKVALDVVKDICDKVKETPRTDIEKDDKVTAEESDNCNESDKSSKKPLNVLKHLSHLLTVKPINKPKSPTFPNSSAPDKINDKTECKYENLSDNGSDYEEEPPRDNRESIAEEKQNNTPKLDALKNVSKHITIKSLSQSNNVTQVAEKTSQNMVVNDFSGDDCASEVNKSALSLMENFNKIKNLHSNLIIKKTQTTNSEIKASSPNHSPKIVKKALPVKEKASDSEEDIIKKQSCDLLKRIPNIKAKAINAVNNSKNMSLQSQSVNLPDVSKKQEDIEIFNIDDSDDENEKALVDNKQVSTPTPACNKIEQSAEMIKTLGKHITIIKPTSQSKPIYHDEENEKSQVIAKPLVVNKLVTTPKQTAFNKLEHSTEMLKTLSKHITIKPTSQPKPINSDDDNDRSQERAKSLVDNKQATTPKQSACNKIEQSTGMLKTLSKHITIKPKSQPKSIQKQSLQNFGASSDEETEFNDQEDEMDNALPPHTKSINTTNTVLKNKLQNLGGITIKSNSSNSPHLIPPQEDAHINDEDYNSDSNMSANIKISELPDDFTSDDDFPLVKNKPIVQPTKNVIVEEPDSDNDAPNEDCEDIESQLKPSVLMKQAEVSNTRPACLNNLKNITIKSSKDNERGQELESPTPQKGKNMTPNQNKDLSVKPFRQANIPLQDDMQESMSNAHKSQRSSQMSASKQTNTVNKEVRVQSVQTFKTQTVIEEVTTTVTKTIRTVNQTVQQEMRNMNSSMPLRPQKIQGFQQLRNVQGKPVRPPVATMGPRVRAANTAVRPLVGTSIRPCNQLVPVRPAINVVRANNPNKAVNRPSIPATNSSKAVGKPLKIAPNAFMQNSKRPASDANRPFSCFKKAKESLIPGLDLPGESDEAIERFASSTQMSKSNVTCTSKSIQGNSVVMSTHSKSDFNASSEQLSRLNNLTGLKVSKTSQVKQASIVEETTEVGASKRSALAAIEKLQKQGLLVKKPRIEAPDYSEHSNSEGDDYYDT